MSNLPTLPDNQRWLIGRTFMFLDVRLQEKRWWGWRTIAQSTGLVSGGDFAVQMCVEHIMKRDYFARLRAEAEHERVKRVQQIPFGTHRGGRHE